MSDLTWDQDKASYVGTRNDGTKITVPGDEWTEAIHHSIEEFINNQFPVDTGETFTGTLEDFREVWPSLYEHYENLSWSEVNDVMFWNDEYNELEAKEERAC